MWCVPRVVVVGVVCVVMRLLMWLLIVGVVRLCVCIVRYD